MYQDGNGSYVYLNGEIKILHPKIDIMVSSADDLDDLTEKLAPGSTAYTAGGEKWVLGLDYQWNELGTPTVTEAEEVSDGEGT